jgi:hypothetical protein
MRKRPGPLAEKLVCLELSWTIRNYLVILFTCILFLFQVYYSHSLSLPPLVLFFFPFVLRFGSAISYFLVVLCKLLGFLPLNGYNSLMTTLTPPLSYQLSSAAFLLPLAWLS